MRDFQTRDLRVIHFVILHSWLSKLIHLSMQFSHFTFVTLFQNYLTLKAKFRILGPTPVKIRGEVG